MQDEITKHSKKVIKVMKNSEHSIVEKIKEMNQAHRIRSSLNA